MTETVDISIEKAGKSKLDSMSLDNLPFGQVFTDHMLEADYEDGEWKQVRIRPYQALQLEPSLAALHYGQAIFEGIKAYRTKDDEVMIFRPNDNFRRFNQSAARMNMPEVPHEIFIDGMRQLISLDQRWVPGKEDHSLYIRPVMFSTDEVLGVRPSMKYKFLIILSPTGPYYVNPMKIAVEEKYTRAAPGGVGFSKNAGNYGGSMLASTLAKQEGFDQVLWTDAFEHRWLQEVGMMNVFFIIDGIAVTPSLDEGTILEGVTRDSVIRGLEEMGIRTEERKISIDEVVDAYDEKRITEVFGTGTAAVIAPIRELYYKGASMHFDPSTFTISAGVKKWLNEIRSGERADRYNWMVRI